MLQLKALNYLLNYKSHIQETHYKLLSFVLYLCSNYKAMLLLLLIVTFNLIHSPFFSLSFQMDHNKKMKLIIIAFFATLAFSLGVL